MDRISSSRESNSSGVISSVGISSTPKMSPVSSSATTILECPGNGSFGIFPRGLYSVGTDCFSAVDCGGLLLVPRFGPGTDVDDAAVGLDGGCVLVEDDLVGGAAGLLTEEEGARAEREVFDVLLPPPVVPGVFPGLEVSHLAGISMFLEVILVKEGSRL